jgi:GH25 family lysozyme M1 (1,4-beta-N-acetylmuramidase)
MTTPPYQLKQPMGYDLYEGEWEESWIPEQGYRGIFRASAKFYDGIIREDRQVKNYTDRCKIYQQKYGLYHFLLPNDIQKQADLFLSVANRIGYGHMPLIVDVEIYTPSFNISNGAWQNQVKTFLDLIEKVTGEKPMIYTSKEMWSYVCVNGVPPAWTSSYPLWMAWYPYVEFLDTINQPPKSLIPLGWKTWDVWQYQDSGRSYGYPSNDYNLFSENYVKVLDAKYGNNDVSTFPSDIYIDNKNYKEVL